MVHTNEWCWEVLGSGLVALDFETLILSVWVALMFLGPPPPSGFHSPFGFCCSALVVARLGEGSRPHSPAALLWFSFSPLGVR